MKMAELPKVDPLGSSAVFLSNNSESDHQCDIEEEAITCFPPQKKLLTYTKIVV